MSTASVSSPKKRTNKQNPARWDDEKTKILLEVFAFEITEGNRSAGVFSKQGWINIIRNFNVRTCLNYNKEQIKNRQDNLRCEYIRWEKLIGKETGLGWDSEKKTSAAPDDWWEEKAKVDPTILKYRESGPLHLELLQEVFGGTTANGFYACIPDSDHDPLLNVGYTLEEINIVDGDDNNQGIGSGFINTGDVHSPNNPTPTSSKLRGTKRQRLSSGSRMSSTDRFYNSMQTLASTWRDGIERYEKVRARADEDAITYKEALIQLKAVPGISPRHPLYIKVVRILTNKLHRVAFVTLLEDGVDVLYSWLDSFD